MNSGFYYLKRSSSSSTPENEATDNLPWADCLSKYNDKLISDAWTGLFSKTAATRSVYYAARSGSAPKEDNKVLLRALLTDRGLLFPQTRERANAQVSCSMRLHVRNSRFIYSEARRLTSSQRSLLYRYYEYACAVRSRRMQSCEDHPIICQTRMLKAIRLIVSHRKGPGPISIHSTWEVGYCEGLLSKYNYKYRPKRVEQIMRKWLRNVYILYGASARVKAPERLAGFTVLEQYELLAHILPSCTEKERLYQKAKTDLTGYSPVLGRSDAEPFQEQVDSFHKETLLHWKQAVPALKQYLNLDLSTLLDGGISYPELDSVMADCTTRLADSFRTYLQAMEPSLQNPEATIKSLAVFFAASLWEAPRKKAFKGAKKQFVQSITNRNWEDARPVFLDRPEIIFHVFRSPVHRYLFQRFDRNWKIDHVIAGVYSNPLPITPQSLPTDKALFFSILDFCDAGCELYQIHFQRQAWEHLWKCIQQTVECLTFRPEDLVCWNAGFRKLLFQREHGYSTLERWMLERFASEKSPTYISLWRVLVNDYSNPSRSENSPEYRLLSDAVAQYRRWFEDPGTDEHDVRHYLEALCRKFGWTQIIAAPTSEEKAVLLENDPKAKKALDIIAKDRVRKNIGEDNVLAELAREVELAHMEWLLLQLVCSQAQRELMETALILLSPDTQTPA